MDKSPHNLELLAVAQAILGGVIALTAGLVFLVKPNLLQNEMASFVLGIVGLVELCYYLSLHRWLKDKHLQLSTIILTVLTSANFGLLIVQTGGADSAFYSFWLLIIIMCGLFGPVYIYTATAASLIFFLTALPRNDSIPRFLGGHVGELLATLVTAGVAHWAYARLQKASAAANQAASRIGEEQVRAMALMNNINDGVMVIDAKRRVQLLNPAAAILTGWDKDSAVGLDSSLIFKLKTGDDTDIPPERDPFTEAWQKGTGIVKNSLTLITKSGRRLAVTLSVSPLFDVNRQPSGGIVLFRDISSEREMDRQRSEFISTASHEMRTPIAALEGYISLAMNPNVAHIDTRAKEYLEKAHNTILHLGQLFKDLLSAAKMEEGGVIEKIEPVEVGSIIKEIIDNLSFAAGKKGLGLDFQNTLDPSRQSLAPLYYVRANPERLREVTTNLIDNAIKFTTAGKVTVTVTGTADVVTVSVKDTGAGIAPEDIPHLFQKFYRVDNSATRTTGGTGLGLYLCRTIIERYQGRIWVESAVGKGSAFNFSLPRLSTTQVQQTQALVSGQATGVH